MKKQNIFRGKLLGGLIVIACSVGLAYVVTQTPIGTNSVLSAGFASYRNADLKFSVVAPSDADITTSLEESEGLGRIGAVSFAEEKTAYTDPVPTVTVHVYRAKEKLESDFWDSSAEGDTFSEGMESLGLLVSSASIDEKASSIFSGVHPVDGVGGSEYDYVAAEVSGPTYAYMIEFRNMGTDPSSANVQQYLASFRAE